MSERKVTPFASGSKAAQPSFDNRTSDPKDIPPAGRPPGFPAKSASPPKPAVPGTPASDRTPGRVVHDERGNAVWDWVKETGRAAIESTSRLLKRLELPELKTEEQADQELRIESDRDSGGGYDPYNQANKGRRGKRAG